LFIEPLNARIVLSASGLMPWAFAAGAAHADPPAAWNTNAASSSAVPDGMVHDTADRDSESRSSAFNDNTVTDVGPNNAGTAGTTVADCSQGASQGSSTSFRAQDASPQPVAIAPPAIAPAGGDWTNSFPMSGDLYRQISGSGASSADSGQQNCFTPPSAANAEVVTPGYGGMPVAADAGDGGMVAIAPAGYKSIVLPPSNNVPSPVNDVLQPIDNSQPAFSSIVDTHGDYGSSFSIAPASVTVVFSQVSFSHPPTDHSASPSIANLDHHANSDGTSLTPTDSSGTSSGSSAAVVSAAPVGSSNSSLAGGLSTSAAAVQSRSDSLTQPPNPAVRSTLSANGSADQSGIDQQGTDQGGTVDIGPPQTAEALPLPQAPSDGGNSENDPNGSEPGGTNWMDFERNLLEHLSESRVTEARIAPPSEPQGPTSIDLQKPPTLSAAAEGGTVELVATDPQSGPESDVAAAAPAAIDLSSTQVQMDTGVALFQAFELGTAPTQQDGEDDAPAADSQELPAEPPKDVAHELLDEPLHSAAALPAAGVLAGLIKAVDASSRDEESDKVRVDGRGVRPRLE
jgi:hypothetical protein